MQVEQILDKTYRLLMTNVNIIIRKETKQMGRVEGKYTLLRPSPWTEGGRGRRYEFPRRAHYCIAEQPVRPNCLARIFAVRSHNRYVKRNIQLTCKQTDERTDKQNGSQCYGLTERTTVSRAAERRTTNA